MLLSKEDRSKINSLIEKNNNLLLNLKAKNIKEINYWYSFISSQDTVTNKYFIAKSSIVFLYSIMEKTVKVCSSELLKIIDNSSFFDSNNVEEFLYIINNNKNSMNIIELFIAYTNNSFNHTCSKSNDYSYFVKFGNLNEQVIATIIYIFNMNQFTPTIHIPKLTISTLVKYRHQFAHGDDLIYFNKYCNNTDDNIFNDLTLDIEDTLRLNEQSKSELLNFLNNFIDNTLNYMNYIKNNITNII